MSSFHQAKVLFDGQSKSQIIDDLQLYKLRKIRVVKQDLITTVDRLKQFIHRPDLLKDIKNISTELFAAAKQYLLETQGPSLIGQLKQLIKTLDYQTYMRFF